MYQIWRHIFITEFCAEFNSVVKSFFLKIFSVKLSIFFTFLVTVQQESKKTFWKHDSSSYFFTRILKISLLADFYEVWYLVVVNECCNLTKCHGCSVWRRHDVQNLKALFHYRILRKIQFCSQKFLFRIFLRRNIDFFHVFSHCSARK